MNPFDPPKSRVTDDGTQAGSTAKAVILALLVDIGGSVLASFVFAIAYSTYMSAGGMPVDRIEAELSRDMQQGWGFAFGTMLGLGFSVLGGYVCARISRRQDLRLAYVVGGLSAAFGLVLGWDALSLVMHIPMAAAGIAAVVFGARLGRPPAPTC